jgi:hypothetical protein
MNIDNFVKSPSAALRFIRPDASGRRTVGAQHAVPLQMVLRALHLEFFALLSVFDFLRRRQY